MGSRRLALLALSIAVVGLAVSASRAQAQETFDATSLIGLSVRGTITSSPHPMTNPFCASAPLAIDSSNGPFSIDQLSPSKSGVSISQPGDPGFYEHGLGTLTTDGQVTEIVLVFNVNIPGGGGWVSSGVAFGRCEGTPIQPGATLTTTVANNVCAIGSFARSGDVWTVTGTFATCGSVSSPPPTPTPTPVPTPTPTPTPKPTPAPACTATFGDYYVIDSRGSGETPGTISPPGMHFITVFRQVKSDKSVHYTHNPYPAPGWKSFLGAALHQSGAAYYNSVNDGETWLTAKLKDLHTACPQTKVILTGYSQGAQVSGDVGAANWPNLVGVVLFGDPLYNGADRAADRGGHKNGSLGTRARFFQRAGRMVISYCHSDDPVCQKGVGPLNEPNHTTYDKFNEPAQAANLIAAQS